MGVVSTVSVLPFLSPAPSEAVSLWRAVLLADGQLGTGLRGLSHACLHSTQENPGLGGCLGKHRAVF